MSLKIALCRYEYDPLDRLATRTPLAEAVTRSFYRADRLANEIRGAEQRSFFHHENQLLALQTMTGKALSTTLIATDQPGSVLHAAASGQRTDIAYTPYGHHAPFGNLPGFNGERPDPVTGHYLLGKGYRAYNPVLMRFNSPDSLSPFGEGGLNPYGYCLGDPINRIDPSGHLSWQAGLGLGLSMLGVIASIASFGAATPLAVAGVTTGIASGLAGIAQNVTERMSPETSSVLGLIGGGLGIASIGFGAVAGFQSVANRFANRFIHGLSGKGTINAAKQMSGLGDFQVFEGMPHVTEKIVRMLPAYDLVALSMTSRGINTVVNSSLKPIDKMLSGIKSAQALEGKADLIRTARNIASGSVPGTTPAQLIKAGIDPNKIPHITLADGHATLQEIDEKFHWLEATRNLQILMRKHLS
ncbi:RHS repeat-associated core domain-containing protein [Pseudomonas lijiangensis]|uniref:RHS repeat-associated core domain-containing protein n=1 Tax=Pseudomonas lijiangensis TaxID=2995658 RepID=UPI0034D671EB